MGKKIAKKSAIVYLQAEAKANIETKEKSGKCNCNSNDLVFFCSLSPTPSIFFWFLYDFPWAKTVYYYIIGSLIFIGHFCYETTILFDCVLYFVRTMYLGSLRAMCLECAHILFYLSRIRNTKSRCHYCCCCLIEPTSTTETIHSYTLRRPLRLPLLNAVKNLFEKYSCSIRV